MRKQVKMLTERAANELARKLMRHNKRTLATWMAQEHGKGAFAQVVATTVAPGKEVSPRAITHYMSWGKAELVQAIIENEFLVMP